MLHPLASDWADNSSNAGPSVPGPSPTLHGVLARVGVGWGHASHVKASRDVDVASCEGMGHAPSCRLQCDEAYLDCDGDPRNGCESSIHSVEHCGGCGNACTVPMQ